MERIEALEKAQALLGEKFEGIQAVIDIDKRGIGTAEYTVFWREHPSFHQDMVWAPTLESMIEKLEEALWREM